MKRQKKENQAYSALKSKTLCFSTRCGLVVHFGVYCGRRVKNLKLLMVVT